VGRPVLYGKLSSGTKVDRHGFSPRLGLVDGAAHRTVDAVQILQPFIAGHFVPKYVEMAACPIPAFRFDTQIGLKGLVIG
jgi:hypothetical protein